METTQAYIVTVGPDHTIVLPEDIAVGSTVVVVLLTTPLEGDPHRQARFMATIEAIRAATAIEVSPPVIADTDLEALIKKATLASQSYLPKFCPK
jgi:hypothetical protein